MNIEKLETCCPFVELRQYTLHQGQRDVLIELFDREFVESQEALGMVVIGQFRDLDNPNRFIWLRGFRDMPSRARALEDFYGGPVWKAHRETANATMIDSDNVLLLRPARPASEFQFRNDRPRLGANSNGEGFIVATIYYFETPVTEEFVGFFENAVKPALTEAGASVLAYFVTEHSKNNFPRLPVREGENVFVWFSSFQDESSYADHQAALSKSQRWLGEVSQRLPRWLKSNPEVLKLSPTARSRLRGHECQSDTFIFATQSVRGRDMNVDLQKLNAAVEFLINQNTFKKSLSELHEAINQSSERFVWSVIDLHSIKSELPDDIKSCWIFVLKKDVPSGCHYHPNSVQHMVMIKGQGMSKVGDRTRRILKLGLTNVLEDVWCVIDKGVPHEFFPEQEDMTVVSFHTCEADQLEEIACDTGETRLYEGANEEIS